MLVGTGKVHFKLILNLSNIEFNMAESSFLYIYEQFYHSLILHIIYLHHVVSKKEKIQFSLFPTFSFYFYNFYMNELLFYDFFLKYIRVNLEY